MRCILVLCEWGEWEIGECSRSCGGGVKKLSRNKTVEELFTICEGNGSYEEDCNVQECPGKLNHMTNFFNVKNRGLNANI